MLYWKSFRQVLLYSTVSFVIGCGGGSDGTNKPVTQSSNSSQVSSSESSAMQTAPEENSSSVASTSSPSTATQNVVEITGTVTFDRVQFEGRSFRGLDYEKTVVQPVRGMSIQAINSQGQVLDSDITDDNGNYQLHAEPNTSVRVRVVAELLNESDSQWSVAVKDNTQSNAQYTMDGSLVNVGSGPQQQRDLHASSGWDGSEYTDERSAAPFAILDSIYQAIIVIDEAQPGLVLPPLSVYWSPDNIAIGGNISEGHIGTSYYTSSGPSIYLLGAANNDSDEYDRSVIQHEFGHYVEHQLARTESLGGSHSQSSRLDMRVAFGEAWGNAFAGMVSGDPIYRDSFGGSQALAFAIDVESRGFGTQGWFSESTIQAILYDLFDDEDESNDQIALGFKPILDVLTSDDYLNFTGFASIYPFIHTLRQQQPHLDSNISAMLTSFSIFGEGGYGEGESNNGGSDITLPLYHSLALGETIQVCSDSDYQDYNGMDNRRFIVVDLPSSQSYTFTASQTDGGLARANPQMRIYQQGNYIASITSSSSNTEEGSRHLDAGSYILEVYDELNVDGNSDNSGLACYNVSVR